MLVDLGNVQQAGEAFHDLFHLAVPLPKSVPHLCRHQLDTLGQSLVAFF